MGLRSRPTYRVVAADSRRARNGKYIESVGHYDPRSKLLNLDLERVNYWLSLGAQPSDMVSGLIRRYTREHAPAPESAAVLVPEAAGEPAPAPESAPTTATEPTSQGVSNEGTG